MPEYLAPGVYVEETSYRAKSIEGVGTSTAAFLGPTRFGPHQGAPELITSFADYQRIYGDWERLSLGDTKVDNYIAHAVRAFFAEGGSRCYVMRIWNPPTDGDGHAQAVVGAEKRVTEPETETETDAGKPKEENRYVMKLKARYPGAAGQMEVKLDFKLGPNILRRDGDGWAFSGVKRYDTVLLCPPTIKTPDKPDFAESGGAFYWLDVHPTSNAWLLKNDANKDAATTEAKKQQEPATIMEVTNKTEPPAWEARLVTVDVSVRSFDRTGAAVNEQAWTGLSIHSEHPAALTRYFAQDAKARATQLYVPLVVEAGIREVKEGTDVKRETLDIWSQIFTTDKTYENQGWASKTLIEKINAATPPKTDRFPAPDSFALSMSHMLLGGADGATPTAAQYEGSDTSSNGKTGLKALTDIDEISIVAAPGVTANYADNADDADQVNRLLLAHCETMRYRVAIIDPPRGQLVSEVRTYRSKFDSKFGALYYPWVQIMDPVTEKPAYMPPSGFVAGIYARNDTQTGVHKAPANEVVRLAMGFEATLNKAQQDVLNPEGINCFRSFRETGHRLWGARTISSDPEWKYVNVRRYMCYLEHTIEKGTQWAVFMNNDENLWGNIERTISDFLFNEWKSSRLFGSAPNSAYFVKCDRTTMTQNDLDNGRLICLVGVCPIRPAEFVIFRVGQWTASA